MDCPLISIVLCTYNGAKYLDAQMQSLLNQTYQNIEIIISDDCSTDGTLELLQKRKDVLVKTKKFKNFYFL